MNCHHHNVCKKTAIEMAENLCSERGLRFTESRRQVFEALISSHKLLSAKELMEMIGNKQPPITYRALEFLMEVGLVHYIGSKNSYIACSHVHESENVSQLLVCRDCNDVKEIHVPKLVSGINVKAEEVGFIPIETYIEVIGLCTACQN